MLDHVEHSLVDLPRHCLLHVDCIDMWLQRAFSPGDTYRTLDLVIESPHEWGREARVCRPIRARSESGPFGRRFLAGKKHGIAQHKLASNSRSALDCCLLDARCAVLITVENFRQHEDDAIFE